MAWMSEEAAATVLGVSFRTIRRRVGNGALRTMRQGRQIFVDVEIVHASSPARVSTPTAAAIGTQAGLATATATVATRPLVPRVPHADVQESAVIAAVSTPAHAASGAPIRTHVTETRLPPINPLAALTSAGESAITIAGEHAIRSVPAGAATTMPQTHRPGSWTGPLIWLLLTLFLSASATAGWMYHHGKLQLAGAESKYRQLTLTREQTQAEHERQMAARDTAANDRENKLVSEATALKDRLDDATRGLADQQKLNAKLTANLNETTAAMARLEVEHSGLTNKLAAATAGNSILRLQLAAAGTLRQAAGQLAHVIHAAQGTETTMPVPVAEMHTGVPFSPAPPPAPDELTDSVPRRRLLPYQPLSLGQEDARAALRPIVDPDPRYSAAAPE